MKFENHRFSIDRLKLAQENATEKNQTVVGAVEGLDPITKVDRDDDAVLWDRETGGLSFAQDGAVVYCLPFRPEQQKFIVDSDPFKRIDDTAKKKYE